MKQICLIGPVDKRVIAYPLLKVLDLVGKTLVITDDSNFRRFAENYENDFTLGRSDFVVTRDVSKFIVEELGVRLNNYDFVLFITTNTLMENNDSIVYCHGSNLSISTEDTLTELENVEYKDVLISLGKVKIKDGLKIDITKENFGYVWGCEETKTFLPCKVGELAKVSAFLFSNIVGIKKEEYLKVLTRQGV